MKMKNESEVSALLFKEKKSKDAQDFCCAPNFIEPMAFFYGFAYFSSMELTQVYLKSRMNEEINSRLHSTGQEKLEPSVLGNFLYMYVMLKGNSSSVDNLQVDASSHAAFYSTLLALSRCIPPCITSLIICACTDVVGRKFGLVLPMIGGLIRGIIYLHVVIYQLPLEWLCVGEFLDGFLGEHTVFQGSICAYASDINHSDHFVMKFLITNSIISISASIGELVTGFTIEYFGFFYTLMLPVAAYFLALLYTLLLLPESLREKDRKSFSLTRVFEKISDGFETVSHPKEGPWKRATNYLLFTSAFIIIFTFSSHNVLLTIYAQGSPFLMNPAYIGFMLSLCAIIGSVTQPLLVRILKYCISDEILLFMLGIMSSAVFLMIALSDTALHLFIGKHQFLLTFFCILL